MIIKISFSTFVFRLPEQEISLICLSNLMGGACRHRPALFASLCWNSHAQRQLKIPGDSPGETETFSARHLKLSAPQQRNTHSLLSLSRVSKRFSPSPCVQLSQRGRHHSREGRAQQIIIWKRFTHRRLKPTLSCKLIFQSSFSPISTFVSRHFINFI